MFKRSLGVICSSGIGFLLFGLVGCGTAHQFVPPQPLESGHWEIQTYWHYDLGSGRSPLAAVFPSVNFYTGLGQQFNFGFSAGQLLFIPANITLSRGYQAGDGNFWTHYLTYTTPVSGTVNPIWETGVAYTSVEDDISQTCTAGLGLGQATAWEDKSLRYSGWGKTTSPLIPVLKYTYTGREAALSWSYYYGNSRAWMKPFVDDLSEHNDTVLAYTAGEIANVSATSSYSFHFPSSMVEITRSDGTVDTLYRRIRFAGCVMPIMFVGMSDYLRYWIGSEYEEFEYQGTSLILNVIDLKERAGTGEAIVLRRFPDELVSRVRGLSPWTSDHSFGVAVLSHPEKSTEK